MTPRAVLALGLALALLAGGAGVRADQASATTQQDEQVFISLINGLRADKGLAPLTVHAELTTLARAWTGTMATSDQLVHTPDMASGITASWTVLGENVGVHGAHEIEQLFQAFVASPTHYQNLVDPRFNYVGVGVVNTSAGKLWTTHRFMAAEPVAPATTTPPATSQPKTTAPTTTASPVTVPPTTASPITVPPTTASPVTPAPTTGSPTTAPPATLPQTIQAPSTTAAQQPTATDAPAASDLPPPPQAEPDVDTVEQVLMELVEAGI